MQRDFAVDHFHEMTVRCEVASAPGNSHSNSTFRVVLVG